MLNHQTLHLFNGFILEPSEHLKSFENSWRLLNGPIILNLANEWTPVVIRIFISSVSKHLKITFKLNAWIKMLFDISYQDDMLSTKFAQLISRKVDLSWSSCRAKVLRVHSIAPIFDKRDKLWSNLHCQQCFLLECWFHSASNQRLVQ